MRVHALDHYNLRAPRPLLDRLRDFYCDVVGLRVGERPPFRRFGYGLYAGEKPVLHLGVAAEGVACATNVETTFNHASFSCTGRKAFEQRLTERGIAYRVAQVPLTGQVQLFFRDPAGNGVELGFPADEV